MELSPELQRRLDAERLNELKARQRLARAAHRNPAMRLFAEAGERRA